MKQENNGSHQFTEVTSIVSGLGQAKDEESCLAQVYQIFDIYGLAHGCFVNAKKVKARSGAVWRKVPDDIAEACSKLIHSGKHPAIQLGKSRQFPFDLFDYRNSLWHDPDVDALYVSFLEHGIEHAYGLPIQTSDGETYIFVVARPGPKMETVELLALQAICSNAVQQVHQFRLRPCDANVTRKLIAQERDILISIATGQSLDEVASAFNMSMDNFETLIDDIQKRFNAHNLSHTIVLALIEGEFELEDCSLIAT